MDESLTKHVQGFAVLSFHWSGIQQMWPSPKTIGHVTDHVVAETAVSILFVSKFSRLYGPPVIPWSNQQNWLTALMSFKQKRPFRYLHREWPVEWPAIVTKSHMGFQFTPRSMTLYDLELGQGQILLEFRDISCVAGAITAKRMKTDPYCQWRNCSPLNVLYSNV